jgi:hypothetical protein
MSNGGNAVQLTLGVGNAPNCGRALREQVLLSVTKLAFGFHCRQDIPVHTWNDPRKYAGHAVGDRRNGGRQKQQAPNGG